MLLLISIGQLASLKARGSIAEDQVYVAGRSLLSEYQPDLFKRYGVFALYGNENRLTEAAEFYIKKSTEESLGFVRSRLEKVHVYSDVYPGLNYEIFARQIEKISLASEAENLLSSDAFEALQGLLDMGSFSALENVGDVIGNLSELAQSAREDAESSLNTGDDEDSETVNPGIDQPESEDTQEAYKESMAIADEADSLKDLLEQCTACPQAQSSTAGAVISQSIYDYLPSQLVTVKKGYSLSSAEIFKDFGSSALLQSRYAVKHFSNAVNQQDKCVLQNEAEYLLFGGMSDNDNLNSVRNSIFMLRMAVNAVEIAANPQKMAEINTSALAFSFVPQPLASAALLLAEAGLKAGRDLDTLYSGGNVPVLSSVPALTSVLPGSYNDYLCILLMMQQEKERCTRMMDLMEMNLTQKEGAQFAFSEYVYGFEIEASFNGGIINQIHEYK